MLELGTILYIVRYSNSIAQHQHWIWLESLLNYRFRDNVSCLVECWVATPDWCQVSLTWLGQCNPNQIYPGYEYVRRRKYAREWILDWLKTDCWRTLVEEGQGRFSLFAHVCILVPARIIVGYFVTGPYVWCKCPGPSTKRASHSWVLLMVLIGAFNIVIGVKVVRRQTQY
jgi:hypothetical protein